MFFSSKKRMSQEGIDHINVVEGRVLDKTTGLHKMYKDVAGLPTIGYGHLLTRSELTSGKITINGSTKYWRDGLTEQEADDLLDQDLDHFEDAVNKYVKVKLTQYQFEALVSFAFNVGVGAFTDSTLLKRVNSNDWHDVPNQFRRWVYAGGKKVKGLVNRRESEISLWQGEYTH